MIRLLQRSGSDRLSFDVEFDEEIKLSEFIEWAMRSNKAKGRWNFRINCSYYTFDEQRTPERLIGFLGESLVSKGIYTTTASGEPFYDIIIQMPKSIIQEKGEALVERIKEDIKKLKEDILAKTAVSSAEMELRRSQKLLNDLRGA